MQWFLCSFYLTWETVKCLPFYNQVKALSISPWIVKRVTLFGFLMLLKETLTTMASHRCEAFPPWPEVKEFELIFTLSKMLKIGVATNKRFWPRIWLISILYIEVDLFHLHQSQRIQIYSLYRVNEVCCFPPPLLKWSI